MSHRNGRVYRCEICGRLEIGRKIDGIWSLPFGWKGSERRYGECLCEKCYKALKKLIMKGESDGDT